MKSRLPTSPRNALKRRWEESRFRVEGSEACSRVCSVDAEGLSGQSSVAARGVDAASEMVRIDSAGDLDRKHMDCGVRRFGVSIGRWERVLSPRRDSDRLSGRGGADRAGLWCDFGLGGYRSSSLMTMSTSSAEKSSSICLPLVGTGVSMQSGKAGFSLDTDLGGCFIAGVAIRGDEATDDPLREPWEGKGGVSSDCVAGGIGKCGAMVGRRCLGVDCRL